MSGRVGMRRKPSSLRGQGVVVRHARSCRVRGDEGCPCGPTFQAWVYDPDREKKVRRTFSTYDEAGAWRRERLRQIYGERQLPPGRLDEAYSRIRRAAQQLDRALEVAPRSQRTHIEEALAALYTAEDAALRALVEAP